MAKHGRFTKAHDLEVRSERGALRRMVHYKMGDEVTLTDAQADAAMAAGAFEVLADKTPSKREKASS